MTARVIVGSIVKCKKEIDEYIEKNKILPYEIELFEDKIRIEEARLVKKTLSFQISGQKLFIFLGTITVEAQNALLKCLEESNENIHYIFAVDNENLLLPTILSRCRIFKLETESMLNDKIAGLIKEFGQDSSARWEDVDSLITALEDDIELLVPTLRFILLEKIKLNQDVSSSYGYCKKILTLLPLAKNNNVNARVVMESVFL